MMNRGVPSRDKQDRWLSPSTRAMLLAWSFLLGGGWVVTWWLDNSIASLWQNLSGTNPDVRESSDVVRQKKVNTVRRDAESVVNRLESLEHDFNNDGNPEPDVAPSVQAVDEATALASAAQLTKTRQNLRKLQSLQSAWEVRSAAIRSGDLGRRIASSPVHLGLAADLLEQKHPSKETVYDWEQQLKTLAKPVDTKADIANAQLDMTVDHTKLLADLDKQIADAVQVFEKQQFLVEAIITETSGMTPRSQTFEQIVRAQSRAAEIALAERVAAARAEARSAAEQAQAERLAAADRELVEAETIRLEQNSLAEKNRIEILAKAEKDQIEEETRVKEAERHAVIAGLSQEAVRILDAVRSAQLEREFENDLPKIKGYLSAFTTDGYALRTDGTKGPVSLALLKGEGALNSTREGMGKLVTLAHSGSDRPSGPIPYITLFNVGQAPMEPIETAQALLQKYGELMVKKGLLAP